MKKYIPANIETKWQEKWAKDQIYASNLSGEKKSYVLVEFSYPSGDLHIGHWFTWTPPDIFARFKRMQGYTVFFPNGFDAFGLPAENAAIKRDVHPRDWTLSNIESMKRQFNMLGASFTFDHELITCNPEYYRWNQWIFLKMFEIGLAYKGSSISNWCPSCQTVLANEGVEAGHCWRCGTEVVQKEVEQWFLKITEYADRLIWPENPTIDWPKSVRDGQNNWIGKTTGAAIYFQIDGSDQKIKVFTTRPDTLYGATFLVLAPELPIVAEITTPEQAAAVKEYQQSTAKKSELERKEMKQKTGVFTGAYAINPLNNDKIPVWIADYALAGYGTGALFGDAHDDRDVEFANKFEIPLKPTIVTGDKDRDARILSLKEVFTGYGTLVDSGEFTGLTSEEAITKVIEKLAQTNSGEAYVTYHLHDWSIGRQRYWGTPIPVINCPKCGVVAVPYEDLPVELPYEVDFTPKGKPPLATDEAWLKVKCPKCDGEAEREAETMDTFFDSSWYFLRYLNPNLETNPFEPDLANKMLPVDIYFGGAEHTLGHTLYARFFTKFFHDLGMVDFEEFASKRVGHGIVLGPDGNKMSKSKGNVVNPDEQVRKFGADTVRVFLAFFMPYEGVGPWVPERVNGSYRFLQRVWGLQEKVSLSHSELDSESLTPDDHRQMNLTIQKVTEDIQTIKYNTAVAALMEWLNHLSRKAKVAKIEYQNLLKLLAPFAPHITEELWHEIGETETIHLQAWPEVDPAYLTQDLIRIAVQVNGKLRDSIEIKADATEKEASEQALESEKVKKFIDGQVIKKTIYIPGKILSLVV